MAIKRLLFLAGLVALAACETTPVSAPIIPKFGYKYPQPPAQPTLAPSDTVGGTHVPCPDQGPLPKNCQW